MSETHTELIATDVDGRVVLRSVALRVIEGPDRGATQTLERGSVLLGKGEGADLRLTDQRTSRAHVELSLLDTGIRVRDLGSTNGTFFRGARVEGAMVLAPPFELTVGQNRLRVSIVDVPAAESAPPEHRVLAPSGPSSAAHRIRDGLARVADHRAPVCLFGPAGVGKSTAVQALLDASGARPVGLVQLGPSLEPDEMERCLKQAEGGALVVEALHDATSTQLDALRGVLDARDSARLQLWAISTSRVDPRHLVEEGRLSRSAFHQLAPVRLELPRLVERPEDAPEVAEAIAAEVGATSAHAREAVEELAVGGFEDDGWGLRRRILELHTLGRRSTNPARDLPRLPYKEAKAQVLDRFTENYVRELLERHEGHVTRAAEEAGIARQHLAALAKRYGIER